MSEITNVKDAIKVSSHFKSRDLDLDKTSNELWPALLSLKNFLVSYNFLPAKAYFIKKIENLINL